LLARPHPTPASETTQHLQTKGIQGKNMLEKARYSLYTKKKAGRKLLLEISGKE